MFGLGSSKPKASADTTKSSTSSSSKPSPSPTPSISKSNPSSSSSSSFSEGDLTVVSTPEAHLVFTNYVYVSLDQYAAMGGGGKESDIYLLLKDTIIYIVKGHKLIENGTIALSALQRESLKISSGMPIKIIVYSLPTIPSFNLVSLKAEVSLISKRKITIKEAELTQFLRAAFKQHIFTRGQIFCCDFEGTSLKIIPKVLESAIDEKESESKDGNITQFVKIGLLLPSTIIQIEAEETKLFKVEKDQSKAHSRLFSPNFQFADMGIGGLDKEFNSIFRRAFASRLFPAEIIEQMGIKHVRGMLLYGPPGTGKTLIARQIGKMLNCREPKVVNGPEILNKYVGASEENIRKLFADAEADYAANKEGSDLHLIIFDEIDAICKARGSDRGGTGVHDTVVNQLLSKLDGVNSLNNILVIGMTNRKDMIDPALLRPGRLEVHIEIALPDERGRVDIFKIHTRKMRENGKLGKDVDLEKLAQLTKNFSGAEIEGLVKSASSFALYGSIDVTKETVGIKDNMTGVVVTMDDFMAALEEVTPAFGVAEDELKGLIRRPLIDFGIEFKMVLNTVGTLIKQLQNGDRDLLSVLLEGPPSCGKTSVAAQLALDSGFPFVKLISPDNYVGMSESSKCYEINKVFEDAYRSHQSLIIVDGIERLLEYVPIGPRFSNQVLQTLSVLINRVPPKEKHKLFIIATTNNSAVLEEMQMLSVFNVIQAVPQITQPSQITRVMIEALKLEIDPKEAREIADKCIMPISMGNLLLVIDMARQDPRGLNAETFQECILNAGLAGTKKY